MFGLSFQKFFPRRVFAFQNKIEFRANVRQHKGFDVRPLNGVGGAVVLAEICIGAADIALAIVFLVVLQLLLGMNYLHLVPAVGAIDKAGQRKGYAALCPL